MVTWIKFAEEKNSVIFINLDQVVGFIHRESIKEITLWLNGSYHKIEHKKAPDAYNKILEYVQQQIK